MGSHTLSEGVDTAFGLEASSLSAPEEILNQLERLVHSTHFRNSKRYPALLSFIVLETLAGRTDSLKERTLGAEVFGRPIDYDTNADPVVRVTAGEVRKRIAQYYQSPGHENELRFDLPLGSYVPHFVPAAFVTHTAELLHSDLHPGLGPRDEHPELDTHPDVPPNRSVRPTHTEAFPLSDPKAIGPSKASLRNLRMALILTLVSAAIAGTLIAISLLDRPKKLEGITLFWSPLLRSKDATLIILGMHSFDSNGRDISPASYASYPKEPQTMLASMIRMDMVPVSDVVSYSQFTDLLARNAHPYRTQGAADTTFDQLGHGPVILIGGFDNVWTMRLTSALRYRFKTDTESIHEIQDSTDPAVNWKFDNAQSALSNSRDYAIVGAFFDPQIGQYVFFAAGIGQSGTDAGARFLTDDKYLLAWMKNRGVRRQENVEIVLSTEIVEGQHGPPQEIASYVW